MKKTVMQLDDNGKHYRVIKDMDTDRNPYSIYKYTFDGEIKLHRKKIAVYQDFQSVLWHILQDGYGVRC